jgi:membrane protein implicated in regulation of membrane protease activity
VRPVGGVVTAGVGSAGMPGLFGLPLAMEAAVLVVVVVVVVWLLRRRAGRSEETARMLAEGCCPACLAAGALAAARLRTRTAP